MSACYSVNLELRPKDETKTIEAMKKFIKENHLKADFMIEEYKKDGIGTESLKDLVAIMLAGWSGQRIKIRPLKKGFKSYSNDFNARYGWLRVIEGWFRAIGETLENGSEISIWVENSLEHYEVEDGEVV